MRRTITYLVYLVIVLLLLGLPTLFRFLRFNSLGGTDVMEPPAYEPSGMNELAPTPAAFEFVDEPGVGSGQVLLDQAHDNSFNLQEIAYLDGRLSARGYELVSYVEGDLASSLRPASAFVVIAPMIDFNQAEIQAVTDFVDRGGRLFLAGDPTRFTLAFEDDPQDITPYGYRVNSDQIPLNSLANEFDLNYNGDYVYNTVTNEGNYRNIIISDGGFEPDSLTVGVSRLAFYGSHSIQVDNDSLALLTADNNTWSSATDRPGGLVLAALSGNGRVLALGDIDFLAGPYYTVFDNSRFIAQVADFLTADDRDPTLADFPYFFDDTIELVYSGDPELGPDAFDEIIAWQAAFRATGRLLVLTNEASGSSGTLFLGLYNQAGDVAGLLAAEDITLEIDPPIKTETDQGGESQEAGERVAGDNDREKAGDSEGEDKITRVVRSNIGTVQMAGTALILLTEELGQPRLIVLAASAEGLANTADRLIELMPAGVEQTLADCLLQGNLALCPTGVSDEEVEAELLSGGSPEPPLEEEVEETEEPDQDEAGSEEEVIEEDETSEEGGDSIVPDAKLQGSIGPDETVEATLEPEQAHAWTFTDGPALLTIILLPEEPVDGILELYDPDGTLMGSSDSGYTGGEERLEYAEIPDDQLYTIVVRNFYDEGGDYTLSLETVTVEDITATDQGSLIDGESVEGNLEEGSIDSWTFEVDAPTDATITMIPDEELDGLLLLFGPDGRFIISADDGFTGEEESIQALELVEVGEYTVVVGGYFFGGGSYTLLLELTP